MEANSAKDSEQQLDPFAIMRQYMADLQERAKKDPIVDGPEYILSGKWGMVQNGQRYSKSNIITAVHFNSLLIVPQNAKIVEKKENLTVQQKKLLILGFAQKHPIQLVHDINDLILEYFHDTIIEIFIKKSLGFHGHPPASIDIRVCHKNMGIASRTIDSKLLIGSFGEWSNMEGAARVHLLFLVPPHIKYTKSGGSSGDYSMINGDGEVFGGYWYGATNCGAEWNKIKEEIDPQHYYKVHANNAQQ